MIAHIQPSSLRGIVQAIPSKSMAHRLLILQALAGGRGEVALGATSKDIEATRGCLLVLRDAIARATSHTPQAPDPVVLDCGESGSTLRFLLPVICALGLPARLVLHGRLAARPLAPLDAELASHGARVTLRDGVVEAEGMLRGGRFVLPGDVSSQYVSGLLLASPLLAEDVEIWVSRPVQSRPYIDLTIDALQTFGQRVTSDVAELDGTSYERFRVSPAPLSAPATCVVEGDWSNAAFWLCAGALEPDGLTVAGLNLQSAQGDAAVLAALSLFGARIARRGDAARATSFSPRAAQLDVSSIPDLAAPLAAVATTMPGTSVLRNAGRLRLKESDRIATIRETLRALGGRVSVTGDDIVIDGVAQLAGGTVSAHNDHRIAMMAAIMATHAAGPTTILGADCVAKSYPGFWEDYAAAGGVVRLANEE